MISAKTRWLLAAMFMLVALLAVHLLSSTIQAQVRSNAPQLGTDAPVPVRQPTSLSTAASAKQLNTPTTAAYMYLAPEAAGAGYDAAPANGGTVGQGSRFIFDLMVNAGTHVAPNGVYGQQSYLTFPSGIIRNASVASIATGCISSTTVTADVSVFDTTVQNEVCNGPGSCIFRGYTVSPGSFAFASLALINCPAGCPDAGQPPPQNTSPFRVARVAFCALNAGTATLTWDFSPPAPVTRDTEILDVNGDIVSNPALFSSYTFNVVPVSSTPTPTPVLVGHALWQGPPVQPNARQQLPITLTLRLGASVWDYPVQNTDASGYFTVPVAGLANGAYNWRVKGPKYLATSDMVTLNGARVTPLDVGLMRAGDADNDNVVTITDFSITRATFGKSSDQPGYDARSDFNNDAVITITDINLVRGNFGSSGSPPIGPGGP